MIGNKKKNSNSASGLRLRGLEPRCQEEGKAVRGFAVGPARLRTAGTGIVCDQRKEGVGRLMRFGQKTVCASRMICDLPIIRSFECVTRNEDFEGGASQTIRTTGSGHMSSKQRYFHPHLGRSNVAPQKNSPTGPTIVPYTFFPVAPPTHPTSTVSTSARRVGRCSLPPSLPPSGFVRRIRRPTTSWPLKCMSISIP